MARRFHPTAVAVVIGGIAGMLGSSPAHGAPTEPETLVNPLEPAQECRYCHEYGNADDAESDILYAPFFGWQGSMMGNAARDPVFWAGVALAHQDDPTETESCVRCHSPRAFLEGRGDAIAIDELTDADLNGVDCEVCHRMMNDPEVDPGNAMYTIDDTLVGDKVPRRGPWDYTDGVPQPDAHPTIADPWVGSSEMCGTCHDVTTPRQRLDDDGQPMGVLFNEQRTYSEWLGSAYAQQGPDFASCQDCHMPAAGPKPGCKDYVDIHSHTDGGRRHDLVGANHFMLQLLQQEYGPALNEYYWQLALERTDEFLQTAATLEVQAPSEVDANAGLSGLEVTVTNETGHKLPTGYSEGRVMWIEVVASYGEEIVWSSGLWDASTGMFEQDDQLRRYEAIGENYADGQKFHLLRNDHWIVDNRLPPKGLTPNIETDPVTDRYELQADGTWPHFDTTIYDFEARDDVVDQTPESEDDDELQIRVRLLYLINTREYIELLAEDNVTNDAGTHIAGLFEDAGWATPVVVGTEQTLTVPLRGLAEPPAGTGSTTGTSDTAETTADTADDSATTGLPSTTSETTGTTDDTTTEETTEPSGCSCRTDSTAAPAWWLMAVFGLGGFARRRSARG